MLLVVPFAAMFFIAAGWAMTAALALTVVAAATDWLDGRIARVRGEVSALGAALDPIADKLFVVAGLVLLIRSGAISGAGVVAALAIILREMLVSGLREAVGQRGGDLPVSTLAKYKTAAQLAALAVLIAAAPGGPVGPSAAPLAAGALWAAAVLTIWSGADYVARAAGRLKG